MKTIKLCPTCQTLMRRLSDEESANLVLGPSAYRAYPDQRHESLLPSLVLPNPPEAWVCDKCARQDLTTSTVWRRQTGNEKINSYLDEDIKKATEDVVQEMSQRWDKYLFYGVDYASNKQAWTATLAVSSSVTPEGPKLNFEELEKKSAELRQKAKEIGVVWPNLIYYRIFSHIPETDPSAEEKTYFFFRQYGYYLVHPNDFRQFREQVEKAGCRTVEMLPDSEYAPGYEPEKDKYEQSAKD